MSRVKIAVVGSGPGGLSAAAHAAELGVSHVLLEKTHHHSHTIQLYQKGKHVMDEPGILPLRSPLEFEAGTREHILDTWLQGLEQYGTNVQYSAEVTKIEGQAGQFTLHVKNQDPVEAEAIVLGIGVQGNLRKLGVPGEDLPSVQYQLDDPDEFKGKTVVVVGAGDAAIENAVALAKQNTVFIVNRRDEFARAKEGNLNLITSHIEEGKIQCFYKSSPKEVRASDDEKPYIITLKTESGEADIPCDLVIARLGAIPQRNLVESFGVQFPENKDPAALPILSTTYESSVNGLYIIGALGGYPLIKQAMNQGYEVVEYILGNKVQPADHPLLDDKFNPLPFGLQVDETLELMQERIPVFGEINPLLFREFMLDSQVHLFNPGETIYKKDDYTNTFFTVLSGEARVELEGDAEKSHLIDAGEVIGEQSLISGRRRNETVTAAEECIVVETPRRTMVKLINSNETIKYGIDQVFIGRALQTSFTPHTPIEELRNIIQAAKLHSFKAGDYVYQEGDEGDTIHLVRIGSLTVSRHIGGRDMVLAYIPVGKYVGELALMGNTKRMDTVRASVNTETISLNRAAFLDLLAKEPGLKDAVQKQMQQRFDEQTRLAARPEGGDILTFLMQQGLGEATNVLVIDEALCVGCDNCEKACAETHNGTARLNRESGPSFAKMHIPIACRHCEHPHCMKDCPPNALQRAADGAVFIDNTCIGCGNCERNCPYDAIHMTYKPDHKPSLWRWLLTGAGQAPGADIAKDHTPEPSDSKKAVKCDLCKDLPSGPACVRACPTGAAIRIGPEQYVDLVTQSTN